MSQPSKTQQPESKPPDFHRLHDVVAELDAHSTDASHTVIVEALDTLAAAVALIPSASPSSTSRVPEIAKQLASSDPGSLEHADLAKRALALVLADLHQIVPPPARRVSFEQVVTVFGTAVDRIAPDRPLLEQSDVVRNAFRAATDAVRLAADEPTWFGTVAQERAAISFATARDDAQSALLAFGGASWSEARDPAARAISALADLLGATAGCQPNQDFGQHIIEMRFQAGRIRRSEALSMGTAASIKHALSAAVAGLVTVNRQSGPASWMVSAAGDSIAKIDDHSSLPFSRGPLQDALRATFDAALVTCQSGLSSVPEQAR